MDEDIEDTSIADKRLFYLMLSIAQGQLFAKEMGFSNPSPDVAQAEFFDIASRWSLFVNQGILDNIAESTEWLLDLLQQQEKLVTPREDLLPFFIAYGVSLVNKLLENGNVHIIINEESLLGWDQNE